MANKVPPRNKIDKKYTWNAESVFPSDAAWEKEVEQIGRDIEKVKQYQGRLAEGPSVLLDALDTSNDLLSRAQIAFMYAGFSYNVDTTNQKAGRIIGKAQGMFGQVISTVSLTSLLGYGLAVIAVVIDLGRFWGLWKVPIFVWRWSHSPQLEVALCVAAYNLVLLIELSPALFEKLRTSASTGLRRFAETGLRLVEKNFVWLLALGLLLPTMHQSSLGTMMLLPGPRMHPLCFTPLLPLLFLINCISMGLAVVPREANVSAKAFGRKRETPMLASLGQQVLGVVILLSAAVAIYFVADLITKLRGKK